MGKREASPQERRWQYLIWSAQGPPSVAQRAICQALFMLRMSGRDDRIFPSERKLAEMTGQCERTVREHLAKLEAGRWIGRRSIGTAAGKGHRRYEYALDWPKGIDPDSDEWLQATEEKRKQARAEYREDDRWQPADDEEAARIEAVRAAAYAGQPQEGEYLPRGDPDEIDLTGIMDQPPPAPAPRPAAPARPSWYEEPPLLSVDPAAWREYVHYRTVMRREALSWEAAQMAATALSSYRTGRRNDPKAAARQMAAVQATIARGKVKIERAA